MSSAITASDFTAAGPPPPAAPPTLGVVASDAAKALWEKHHGHRRQGSHLPDGTTVWIATAALADLARPDFLPTDDAAGHPDPARAALEAAFPGPEPGLERVVVLPAMEVFGGYQKPRIPVPTLYLVLPRPRPVDEADRLDPSQLAAWAAAHGDLLIDYLDGHQLPEAAGWADADLVVARIPETAYAAVRHRPGHAKVRRAARDRGERKRAERQDRDRRIAVGRSAAGTLMREIRAALVARGVGAALAFDTGELAALPALAAILARFDGPAAHRRLVARRIRHNEAGRAIEAAYAPWAAFRAAARDLPGGLVDLVRQPEHTLDTYATANALAWVATELAARPPRPPRGGRPAPEPPDALDPATLRVGEALEFREDAPACHVPTLAGSRPALAGDRIQVDEVAGDRVRYLLRGKVGTYAPIRLLRRPD